MTHRLLVVLTALMAPLSALDQPPPLVNLEELQAKINALQTDNQRLRDEGRALYVQNCARCHGPDGRGDGPTKVFPPPRNFREGGFSFGNTEVAIMRTIANGIPGTAMTPFGTVLSEEQRRSVARYVRSLLPEAAKKGGGASRVVITDRPTILRGYLKAGLKEKETWPRGLAVGVPGGLSFALRADDVRLLEVRRGPFVDRTDWGGRGGSPLRFLGRRWVRIADGDPDATWRLASALGDRKLKSVLRATETMKKEACLATALVDDSGRGLATARESLRLAEAAGAVGYRRRFEVTAGKEAIDLVLEAYGGEAGVQWKEGLYPVTRRFGPAGEFEVEEWPHWFAAPLKMGGFRLVHVVAPEGTRLRHDATRVHLRLPRLAAGASARVDVAVLESPQFDEDVCDTLATDLEF